MIDVTEFMDAKKNKQLEKCRERARNGTCNNENIFMMNGWNEWDVTEKEDEWALENNCPRRSERRGGTEKL